MAAGRCDIYALLLAHSSKQHPKHQKGKAAHGNKQIKYSCLKQRHMTVNRDTTTGSGFSLGRGKKILQDSTFSITDLQISFIIFNNVMYTYS